MFEELTVAWWWLAVAFFCGECFGIFAVCLCVVAGNADDEMDRFCARHDQFDEEEEAEDFVKRMGGRF